MFSVNCRHCLLRGTFFAHRFPIELDVRYKTLSQRAERVEGIGKTLNISSSGVLFTSESELA
jgi:hypothetical protein